MHNLADISLFESVMVYNAHKRDPNTVLWRSPNAEYAPNFTGTDSLIPNRDVDDWLESALEHCSAAVRSMDALYRRDKDGLFFPRDKAKQCYSQLSALYRALVAIGDADRATFSKDWDK